MRLITTDKIMHEGKYCTGLSDRMWLTNFVPVVSSHIIFFLLTNLIFDDGYQIVQYNVGYNFIEIVFYYESNEIMFLHSCF